MSNVAIKPFVASNIIPAVSAAAATASSAAFVLPPGYSYSLVLDVATVTGTSPTMDVVLQTSWDNGTTFIDLPLRYTQVTAAVLRYLVFRNGLGMNEVALEQVAADTGGTLAKNCNFDPFNMKIKYTIGGTNPAFTFKVHLFALPYATLP